MTPETPLTAVTTFNTHLTALLETLADLDRDITNLAHHHDTHPGLLSPSPSPPPPPSSPAPATLKSLRKVKALRETARGIAARLKAFEKDLHAAEKRAAELREKYHQRAADEADKDAVAEMFVQVSEGVELCGRGFGELQGWWAGAGAPF